MLYHFFDWLARNSPFPGVRIFQYLTFRAVLAAIFSLIITIGFGGTLIRLLKRKLIGESIRDVGPESHKAKKGTPTMGGLIIIAAIVIPTLLWGNLTNAYIVLILLATLWMGLVGFADDYIKVFKKDKRGLKGTFKIIGQVGLGLIVGLTMLMHPDFRGKRGHVDSENRIDANDPLTESGFRQRDQLLLVDGRPYDAKITYRSAAEYVVERQRSKLEPPLRLKLSIAPRSRQAVAEELFGYRDVSFITQTNVPFLKNYVFDYGSLVFWAHSPDSFWVKLVYLLVVIFIVTAVSNGVNITDGLDGLAAGTTAIVAAVLGIFAYVSGNILFARYLNVSYIPQSGELFIFCAALLGACVGFLWFNTYPAQVFMGDTGSLALGGAVGVVALMVKKELLLPLVCGIYFVESLSVILQVGYFKYTKRRFGTGRRIFRMAPLHHHYELGGLHEAKIVTRFWILTILLEIIAFSTLKLR